MFKFRLRTFLVMTLAFGVLLGLGGIQYRRLAQEHARQQQIVDALIAGEIEIRFASKDSWWPDYLDTTLLERMEYVEAVSWDQPDATPLAHLPALTSLHLHNPELRDLSPLRRLTRLKTLFIAKTKVADLAPLNNLTELESLMLSDTRVSDLSPLRGLKKLQLITINNLPVNDLSPLAGCQNLRSLHAGATNVSDLSALSGLPSLQELGLGGTPVRDLSPLAKCKSLTSLNLRETEVEDLQPLAHCHALTTLNIDGCRVTDLSCLTELPLEFLSIAGLKVDLEPVQHMKRLEHLFGVPPESPDMLALNEIMPHLYSPTTSGEISLDRELTISGISCAALSPDGRILAIGRYSSHREPKGTIEIWHTQTWTRHEVLTEQPHNIVAVALASDGALLASVGADQTCRLWNVSTGENAHTFEGKEVRDVALSPDGKRLAFADGLTVVVCDIEGWKQVAVLTGHTRRVNTVEFSPDGTTLASGSFDQTVRLWDLDTFKTAATLRHDRECDAIWDVSFAPQGNILAAGHGPIPGRRETTTLWHVSTQKIAAKLGGHSHPVVSLDFSANGNHLATVGLEGNLVVWKIDTSYYKKQRFQQSVRVGNGAGRSTVAFHPSGERLVTRGGYVLKVWTIRE